MSRSRAPWLLALAVGMALGGCRATDDRWMFCVSRGAYDGLNLHRVDSTRMNPGAGLLLMGVLAVPVIVDLALMPVTGPHDLLVRPDVPETETSSQTEGSRE